MAKYRMLSFDENKEYLFYDNGFQDSVRCSCGNAVNFDGFSQVGHEGNILPLDSSRMSKEMYDLDLRYLLCNQCGVMGSIEQSGGGNKLSTVLKYDMSDPTLLEAIRKAYS